MKIHVLFDRIIVKPIDEEKKTEGGLIIAKSAEESAFSRGTVTHAGKGRLSDSGCLVPNQVKVGDIVNFDKYAGGAKTVKISGIDHLVMTEKDVQFIERDEE